MTRKPEPKSAPVHMWLTEPPSPDLKKDIARLARAPDVRHIAIMPDAHIGTGVCIGAVVATGRLIYPQAVGADIGCGMTAVALDAAADLLGDASHANALLVAIADAVPIIRHRTLAAAPVLERSIDPDRLSSAPLASLARREGRIELATLGRGNHFIEIQADEDERLWAMVHSGSRVMGQHITRHHLAQGARTRGGLFALDAETDTGRAYAADAAWAETYAQISRDAMLDAVAAAFRRLFNVRHVPETRFGSSHNHVRRESHAGRDLWVHRKGANAAPDGQAVIIPGSMATQTVHARGRGHPDSLASSSHGAGRARSRSEARRRCTPEGLRNAMRHVHFDARLLRGLVEEGPEAYRDLDAVLRAQRELIRVTRRLRPVLSFKGV